MRRKGMMKGKGKGYKNVIGKDPMVHSQSARGMKQPQKVSARIMRLNNLTIEPTFVPRGSGNNPCGGKRDLHYKIKEWGYIFPTKKQAEEYAKNHINIKGEIKEKKINVTPKKLTQRQKSNRFYEKAIIDAVDSEGHDIKLKTPKEKLQFLKDTFKDEYGWAIDRYGEQRAFKEWIMGLPSSFNIPFMNYDILQFAKKSGSLPKDATEKQEDRVLENYWNFMANKTFQAFRKYKVD